MMRLLPSRLAKPLLRLGFLAALIGLSTPASAWWDYGHETVARIALAEVRPATRAEVMRLLRQGALLDTPDCPVRTIGQASSWADCIRREGDRFSYTASWHYQNVNVCRPFDMESACANGNCVSAQVERNLRLLKDRTLPRRERLQALLFLFHFAAVGVVDPVTEIHAGRLRSFNHQHLVRADAEAPVRQELPLRGREIDALIDGVDHDEVVARAVHFGEFEFHIAVFVRIPRPQFAARFDHTRSARPAVWS